jgi:hypothetical protein
MAQPTSAYVEQQRSHRMTYTGTIKGNEIIFEQRLPFTDGLQVVVHIVSTFPPLPFPTKNSPQAWLKLFAGTVNDDEAELILQGAQECRTVDAKMWESSES